MAETDDIRTLIEQLRQLDNERGYRLSYETASKKLQDTIKRLILAGEPALGQLHKLLEREDTWSCLFSLEALKEMKSEASIPHLIGFIKKNEPGEYWEGCETAMLALQAIGKPAIEPLIQEIRGLFEQNTYYPFLVGSLTGIKDERTYSFMVSLVEDYLKNTEKYIHWLQIDGFTYNFTEQGNKEALPLLRQLLDSGLAAEEKREIKSTIEALEDPERYERSITEEANRFGSEITAGRKKLGRNEPCHCGSAIKYKKCCLDEDMERYGHAIRL